MGVELTTGLAGDWRGSIASVLDWWSDAGVDMLAADDPRDWLAIPAAKRDVEGQSAVAEPVEEKLPETLEAFLVWRMGEDAPEAGWMTPIVPPSGPADAEIMVLTDAPDEEDSERLMSGGNGRLLDKMLAAIGESRDSVHLASLAWARPLAGSIPHEQQARLIQLALHHVSLVAPKTLLILGQSANRVIAGTDGSAMVNGLHDINHSGGNTQAAMIRHPRFLLDKPAAKADAWRQLLLLSRGTSQ